MIMSATVPVAAQASLGTELDRGSAARPAAKVHIVINGVRCSCQAGRDLMAVIREAGFDMPSPCQYLGSDKRGVCKLCLVKIQDERELQLACSTLVTEGMVIHTDLPEIEQARKRNLEQLFAEHYHEASCSDCIWDSGCVFHELAAAYGIEY